MKSSGEPTVVTAYDPVELRRRIAVSFSAPELRRLAEELGVAGQMGWDRGHDEAARSLVRQFERYYGLETLVETLRARRPLVEWPEAQPVQTPAAQLALDATVAAPVSPDAGIAPYVTPAPTVPGAPALPASPGSFGAPPLSASPGSFGAPPLSASPGSFGARASPRVPATVLDEGPILPDPMIPMEPAATRGRPLPGWAGLETASAAARPGKRARRLPWMGAGAALLALAALLAFAAGRASTKDASTRPTEASATSSPVAAEGAAEDEGRKVLSARASLAIARALAAVGRVCELPPSTPRDAAMLDRALEQCGPAPLPDRPLATPARPRTPPPHAEQDDAPERPRTPRAPDPGPRVPTSTERPCIRACDAALQACKGRCGAEPTESRKYEGYQLCQSRCLSTASSCRLACP